MLLTSFAGLGHDQEVVFEPRRSTSTAKGLSRDACHVLQWIAEQSALKRCSTAINTLKESYGPQGE